MVLVDIYKSIGADGSILALFPKFDLDLEKAVLTLNSLAWNDMGFVTGGRFIFSQKSLQEALIKENLFEYLLKH